MYYFVCMHERQQVCFLACKHAWVWEAGAGRATDSEEECQVDCGRGCFGSVNFCHMASVKGHGQNHAWLTNHHTHSDSHTRIRATNEGIDKTDRLTSSLGTSRKMTPTLRRGGWQTDLPTRATPHTHQNCTRTQQPWAHSQTNRKTERQTQRRRQEWTVGNKLCLDRR